MEWNWCRGADEAACVTDHWPSSLQVLATDGDAAAVANCLHNMRLNGVDAFACGDHLELVPVSSAIRGAFARTQ
jgi:hypothetical protein